MKKILFLLVPLTILIASGMVYAQGTPHIVFGNVENMDGSTPDSICIIFKAWIAGGNDTVTHNATGCGYSDGVWGVQCSNFPDAQSGDTLIISIEDTCRSEICQVWGLLNMDEPFESFGFHTTAPVSIREGDNTLPYTFDFLKFFPNPFNAQVNIRITKSANSADVAIFNMLGSKCIQLYNGKIDKEKNLVWDGKNFNNEVVSGGTYICRIELDSEVYYRQIKFLK